SNNGASCDLTNNIIESFINDDHKTINLLKEHLILVTDEVMFDAYYTSDESQHALANFLTKISSEIFLPIYDKNTIIAYLTINQSNRHKFYSIAEQNKIVIFGKFLASVINIMHNSNNLTLLQENKKVKEELYLKHQEVNQYKESIKDLLKQKINSKVGILFYKNGKFSLGNEISQKLLPLNLNHQSTHPTTITISKLAQQVESFRTMQSCFLHDNNNKQLLITGIPHIDYNGGVILTVHYPDSSDVIKSQIDQLQDPSKIDFLLYLETTKSGKLINKIVPSNTEILLNFKLKLLEIALGKKATLVQSHSDDPLSIVEIIHHISLRSTLHIIDLKPTASNHNLAIKLFGLNPILMNDQEESLLKKLDGTGTLFIKNIELLDLVTQNKLAHFIKYGIFTIVKSEQKVSSDVRIICSTSQNPQTLIDQNKLSIVLYKELYATTLTLPSLLTMEEHELQELINGFAYQAIEKSNFTTLLQISKKDKEQSIDRRPASLQEFKSKIQHLIAQKSKDNHIFHETHFDPEFNVTNPKLLKAANLGKHALKDAEIMSMLWLQFKCQNKIAQFLGVNRSSVNRRCKEYNLL
ncbi:MAG: sigma 54-interacting transcriptional regulator, partial [Flavobacteriales bacterium]|nr:sigma 54-interacting transcriptional regulator [Flavobacteriales bacterium]